MLCHCRFDFVRTPHVCFHAKTLRKKLKRSEAGQRRPTQCGRWKRSFVRTKEDSIDCEHLILLLIVQTDGITATDASITLWKCQNANQPHTHTNTYRERENGTKKKSKQEGKKRVRWRKERPKKLMDGNRKRFVRFCPFMNWHHGKRSDFLLSLAFPSGFTCLLIYFFCPSIHCCRSSSTIQTANNHFCCRTAAVAAATATVYRIPLQSTFPLGSIWLFHFHFLAAGFIFSLFFLCIMCSERWMLIPFVFVCDNNSHMVNTEQQENIFGLAQFNLV